jgi:hypothetical protein
VKEFIRFRSGFMTHGITHQQLSILKWIQIFHRARTIGCSFGYRLTIPSIKGLINGFFVGFRFNHRQVRC